LHRRRRRLLLSFHSFYLLGMSLSSPVSDSSCLFSWFHCFFIDVRGVLHLQFYQSFAISLLPGR
jgi:hypothetical protein